MMMCNLGKLCIVVSRIFHRDWNPSRGNFTVFILITGTYRFNGTVEKSIANNVKIRTDVNLWVPNSAVAPTEALGMASQRTIITRLMAIFVQRIQPKLFKHCKTISTLGPNLI